MSFGQNLQTPWRIELCPFRAQDRDGLALLDQMLGDHLRRRLDPQLGRAVAISVAIWGLGVLVWKFILALVPEDTGETILRALIPFARFMYYLFWPFLFPLRRLLERLNRRNDDDDEEDDVEQQPPEPASA